MYTVNLYNMGNYYNTLSLLWLMTKKAYCPARTSTVQSRFLEPSVSRTSRYFEPNLVSLGFASLKLYNFTPDFSNPRFLKTRDNSNQFWLSWDKLTLDNPNLRKFPDYLVRMPITFTPLNKLRTSIIYTKVPGAFLKSELRVSRLQKRQQVVTNYFR